MDDQEHLDNPLLSISPVEEVKALSRWHAFLVAVSFVLIAAGWTDSGSLGRAIDQAAAARAISDGWHDWLPEFFEEQIDFELPFEVERFVLVRLDDDTEVALDLESVRAFAWLQAGGKENEPFKEVPLGRVTSSGKWANQMRAESDDVKGASWPASIREFRSFWDGIRGGTGYLWMTRPPEVVSFTTGPGAAGDDEEIRIVSTTPLLPEGVRRAQVFAPMARGYPCEPVTGVVPLCAKYEEYLVYFTPELNGPTVRGLGRWLASEFDLRYATGAGFEDDFPDLHPYVETDGTQSLQVVREQLLAARSRQERPLTLLGVQADRTQASIFGPIVLLLLQLAVFSYTWTLRFEEEEKVPAWVGVSRWRPMRLITWGLAVLMPPLAVVAVSTPDTAFLWGMLGLSCLASAALAHAAYSFDRQIQIARSTENTDDPTA